nr:Metallopeptidase family M24 [uncultured bacterium]
MKNLFANHLAVQLQNLPSILKDSEFSGLTVYSGDSARYFEDDAAVSFRSNPHFLHYCPAGGEGHALLLRPGKRPTLLFCRPNDYWHEVHDFQDEYWVDGFDIEVYTSGSELWRRLAKLKRFAFIGAETAKAKKAGLKANPAKILHAMRWLRGVKTPYEIQCLKTATAIAARGHKAAQEAFLRGATELEIHLAYLGAAKASEADLPYPSIIGLGEKGAILHYQNRRVAGKSAVLLIDAGFRFQHYGCDITRTHCAPTAHKVFAGLVSALDSVQQDLVSQVKAGLPYVELHKSAHLGIAKILLEADLISNLSTHAVLESGISGAFFPHGLGHLLGIQVHDVGGYQSDIRGRPTHVKAFPNLRLQRPLRANEVITIEPGIYFIPMLLQKFRQHKLSSHFRWPLVEELLSCGGIRIEDNVVVLEHGQENLTRPHLPS